MENKNIDKDSLEPANFYLSEPLYHKIKIDEFSIKEFQDLIDFRGKFDGYNPIIQEQTTYQVISHLQPSFGITRAANVGIKTPENPLAYTKKGGIGNLILKCTRTEEQFYLYVFYDSTTKIFMKIGQYPSIADFHISQIKQYDKVLQKDKLSEFTRAIGLAANGVGIGSFIYLRRIFEHLIEESHLKAKDMENWDEEGYISKRMDDKISLLKDFLPEFLVEHSRMYGIMSDAIHNLNENDCLALYEPIKLAIEIILDEKVDKLKEREKREKAKEMYDKYSVIKSPKY